MNLPICMRIANRFVNTLYEGEEADYTIEEKRKTCQLDRTGCCQGRKRSLSIENFGDPENMEINHHVMRGAEGKSHDARDVDYIVKDGEIVIVDELRARLMFGRRYSNGLHQAIEAKEGVLVRSESKTLATITLQNDFRNV